MEDPPREDLCHVVTGRICEAMCPHFSSTDKDEMNIQNPFFVIQVAESFLETELKMRM